MLKGKNIKTRRNWPQNIYGPSIVWAVKKHKKLKLAQNCEDCYEKAEFRKRMKPVDRKTEKTNICKYLRVL